MIIYFIQVDGGGPVKIGKTNNLEERLRGLQTGHHKKLNILFSFDVPDEKADYAENHIQNVFIDHRIRGEWYNPCPYMYDYIAKIGKDGFWVNGLTDYEEFLKNDPFAVIYNDIYHKIKQVREYGDTRYLRSIIQDLKELQGYAFSGKI